MFLGPSPKKWSEFLKVRQSWVNNLFSVCVHDTSKHHETEQQNEERALGNIPS
jgi:hypothetical protein